MFLSFIRKNLLKIGLFLALIFGIVFGWAWLVFQVKEVSIERSAETINVRSGSLLQIMEYVKTANIILLKTDSLENHFVKTFKELKSVSIKKKYPDTLHISVEPLEIVAQWDYLYEAPKKISLNTAITESAIGKQNTEKNSTEQKKQEKKNSVIKKSGYINKNNVFLEHNTASEEKKENLLIISDKQPRKTEILFYETIQDGHYIPDIVEAKKRLEEVISRKIVGVNYYRDAQEVYFIDDRSVAYWLYLEEDLLAQIKKLDYMLQEKNILKWRLSYIDLRINGKVIYKFDE